MFQCAASVCPQSVSANSYADTHSETIITNMEYFAALQTLDLYLTTLGYLDEKYVLGSDEDLEYYILEELDVDVHSFLYYENVDILVNAGLIPDTVSERTQELRDLIIRILETKRSLDQIRNDIEWKTVRQIAKNILEEIKVFQDLNPIKTKE